MSYAPTTLDTVLMAAKAVTGRLFEPGEDVHAHMDAIEHLEFVMCVEDAFDIEMSDAQVEDCKTFADFAAHVSKRRPDLAATEPALAAPA